MKRLTSLLTIIFVVLFACVQAKDKERKFSKFPLDDYRALFNYSKIRDTLYTLSDSYIDVNLKTQWANLHLKDGSIKPFKVSSGNGKLKKAVSTKTGLYVIQSKMVKWNSKQFDETVMLNWLGFNFGIGFHALETKGYYRNLGRRPSSHGCVRVSQEDAKMLFEKVHLGAPVIVHEGYYAVAIQFANPSVKYTIPNSRNMVLKHKQRLSDLYSGKYLVYYDEKYIINKDNVTHSGLDIGDPFKIPLKPVFYPFFIDIPYITQENPEILKNPENFKMVKTPDLPKVPIPEDE